jgi:hypothetical protein
MREENYFETLDTVVKWLNGAMKEETTFENIEYVARMEGREDSTQF